MTIKKSKLDIMCTVSSSMPNIKSALNTWWFSSPLYIKDVLVFKMIPDATVYISELLIKSLKLSSKPI